MKNAADTATDDIYTLIKIVRVQTMLGLKSRSSVYTKLREDPTFPRPVRVGAHSVAWRLQEVRDYIANLPRAELSGLSGPDQRRAAARGAA
ncbi:helix-turn-helix transcriptional regulator [Paraburkholderia diazotrophica]|uniref:Transcriptional regulator, AlpA family n=1 Tax=Paraburkholderia diazotrophica TaxID=667676 RepID=A0A1H6V0P6_9BURK|nr:transcriptional regulator, AlpA family [Paraburkholderia diazotrophica]